MSSPFESLKEREQKVICQTYGRYPLAVSRAEGCRLYDQGGREYVDLLAGIAVANLGHCRPELAEVMAEQAKKLVHVSNLFYQEEHVALAEKLTATCHADKVFFCNSGAEANEAAIKLARRYMRTVKERDAFGIISLEGSFHGRTYATMAATGQAKIREHFDPMPSGFVTAPWNDIGELEMLIGPKTAAVIVETVQGEGGIRPMDPQYAKDLQALCKGKGILLIVDEIQTGMCRTGSWWGFQNLGLKPDIFTVAKGLANGLPMGAMLCTNEVAKGFAPGSHATTFGGGALISAVACKVMDLMRDDELAKRAMSLGGYAKKLFAKLQNDFPDKVAEIRVQGLMIGLELTEPAQEIWKKLLDRGFVLNCTQNTVLRLLPPLTIEERDLEAFYYSLRQVLSGK